MVRGGGVGKGKEGEGEEVTVWKGSGVMKVFKASILRACP